MALLVDKISGVKRVPMSMDSSHIRSALWPQFQILRLTKYNHSSLLSFSFFLDFIFPSNLVKIAILP